MPDKRNPKSPSHLADLLIKNHLSNDEIYWLVLDQVHTDDIDHLKKAIKTKPGPGQTADDVDRLTNQEVYFTLGLELGRRIGGAR